MGRWATGAANAKRVKCGHRRTETKKNEISQNTAHDVLRRESSASYLLSTTQFYHTMSDTSQYRAQVLAHKAALEARSRQEREQSELPKPAVVEGSASKPHTSFAEDGGSSPSSDAQPAKRRRSQRDPAPVSAKASAPVSAMAPAPEASPDTPNVVSPSVTWPFSVSCANGHVANYILSPEKALFREIKQYFNSTPHLLGILRHCGVSFDNPAGKAPNQMQLRCYVSVITGTATSFTFSDDGSVLESDFKAEPPDFRQPASPARAAPA